MSRIAFALVSLVAFALAAPAADPGKLHFTRDDVGKLPAGWKAAKVQATACRNG